MRKQAIVAALCVAAACDAPATEPADNARTLADAGVTLTLAVRGRGEIVHTADLAGAISCSTVAAGTDRADCVLSYALNTVVTLEPKPASGWVFDHWSGRCAGKQTCTTTLNERLTMEAIFRAAPVPPAFPTLTIALRGRGEITHTADQAGLTSCSTLPPNPEQADCVRTYALNTVITLQPQPATGWVFDHWSGRCAGKQACTTTLNERLTMEAIFKTVVVTPSSYTLRILVRGRGGVQHTADLTGATACTATAATSDRAECVRTYAPGTEVVLTAVPASGFRLSSWSGVCTTAGAGPCTMKANENRTVEIVFQG